ncbi:MAG: hypothetical protein C4538_12245, partial [Nitrospiraceae bacterium]
MQGMSCSNHNKRQKMIQLTAHRKSLLFVLIAFCLSFSYGCYYLEDKSSPSEPNKGQIALFLNGPDKVVDEITFQLAAIDFIAENGTLHELAVSQNEISSLKLKGRQVLLSEGVLPEGRYTKLKLVIKEATVKRKDQTSRLALPPDGTEMPIHSTVRKGQNTSIFLHWDAEGSITDGYLFSPRMAVSGKVPELSTSLVYITNEGSDNVSVLNRQSGEIVTNIMVGKKPKGITAMLAGERLKVYVANSGSNSISVIDPTTNHVETEVPVRFGSGPAGIAAVRVSSGKELVFVTNFDSNSVSVIDTSTFQETEKIDVGKGPVAIAADPPVEKLLGTRFLSFDQINIIRSFRQKFFYVYVLNYYSNTVSVVKMDLLTHRSQEVINIDVGWNPIALDVDYQKGKVYVTNYSSDKLSVIDILQFIKGEDENAVSAINNVGTSITGVISDPVFDRLYL